jgi:hypothetical protein
MTDKAHRSLMDYFGQVPDPRMTRTQRHELLDVLAIALCAVMGGADRWTEQKWSSLPSPGRRGSPPS